MMDIRQTVTSSLAATAKSKQQALLAGQLARQAREAIRIRALHLAEQLPSGISGETMVANWIDDSNRHRKIVINSCGNVFSLMYYAGRPDGLICSSHRLDCTSLEHLEQHFGPLMPADFEALILQ